MYVLLLCPWVKPVWFGGPLGIPINGHGISSFEIWFWRMIDVANCLSDRSCFLYVIAFSC